MDNRIFDNDIHLITLEQAQELFKTAKENLEKAQKNYKNAIDLAAALVREDGFHNGVGIPQNGQYNPTSEDRGDILRGFFEANQELFDAIRSGLYTPKSESDEKVDWNVQSIAEGIVETAMVALKEAQQRYANANEELYKAINRESLQKLSMKENLKNKNDLTIKLLSTLNEIYENKKLSDLEYLNIDENFKNKTYGSFINTLGEHGVQTLEDLDELYAQLILSGMIPFEMAEYVEEMFKQAREELLNRKYPQFPPNYMNDYQNLDLPEGHPEDRM